MSMARKPSGNGRRLLRSGGSPQVKPCFRYQSWSGKALHLSDLGLPLRSLARRLRVDDQTAAKAVRFARDAAPSV